MLAFLGWFFTLATATHGQNLIHRYSFNGSAADSVGHADGTPVGGLLMQSNPNGVNGVLVLAGGTSASGPAYISLPTGTVSALQNATLEIFTTNFNMPNDTGGQPGGPFQALFSASSAFGNLTNYLILSANRAGTGIGVGARGSNVSESIVAAHDPLPVWQANHVVDLVYSGFNGLGSLGTVTIYLDGTVVASGPTSWSFAAVAAGSGGIATVGIGGGSPFNDPTYRGSIDEVRIFDGALSAEQVADDIGAGPATLGFTPPYTLADAVSAIQISGGLETLASAWEESRLDLSAPGGIDVTDAVHIVRKVMGVDANP